MAVAEPAEPEYPEPPAGVHLPGPSAWPFLIPIAATVILYGIIFSAALIVGGIVLAIIGVAGWYRDATREYRSTEEVGHAVPVTRDPAKAWPHRLIPIFGAVIVISVLIVLTPIGLGYLNSLTPPAATAKAVAVPAKPEISAQNIKFSTATLVVPANRPFDLTFDNKDAGVPHNFAIATDSSATTILFAGDKITGVTSTTYHVPSLKPGTYYFLCQVHPNMNGTLQVLPEAGGGAAPPPGASPGS
jgi:plastocyanin